MESCLDGAGACDQIHDGRRLVGRPVRPRRSLCHCISGTNSVVLHFLWTRARTTNGQPGRSVVGPGWLQLGVSNCSFVTRTGVWVHRASFDFRCIMIGFDQETPGAAVPQYDKLQSWQRRTNVWRSRTSPWKGAQRLRSGTSDTPSQQIADLWS